MQKEFNSVKDLYKDNDMDDGFESLDDDNNDLASNFTGK